jgi:hypothetical protein
MGSDSLRCMYLLVLQDAAEQNETIAAKALREGNLMGAVQATRAAGELLALGSLSRNPGVPLRRVRTQAKGLGVRLAAGRGR